MASDQSYSRNITSEPNAPVARDLVQSALSIELLRPSADLWLVSAWISDVGILDNAGGDFASVAPQWPLGEVLLSDYLIHLAQQGTRVHIRTRKGECHNQSFLSRFRGEAGVSGVESQIFIDEIKGEHRKRMVTEKFVLWGSMNFTFNGLARNVEDLQLMRDPVKVAEAVAEMSARNRG